MEIKFIKYEEYYKIIFFLLMHDDHDEKIKK